VAGVAREGTEVVRERTERRETTASAAAATPDQRGASDPKVARIEVDKRERSLRALDKDGKLVAFYPASIGSTEKPAPSGTFKVRTVQYDPIYHYDPKFAFKGVKAKEKFTIKPGPNNPVGSVWIDLTAPSYGIHGTPNPDKVSKTESHGCIRLTNWDARALAGMVRKGTTVAFLD
jgi:lipoprotein-anchoring transpeptidase ErfK/SrfK